jgi:hypothetical protein
MDPLIDWLARMSEGVAVFIMCSAVLAFLAFFVVGMANR